jgi:hypothetical protein
MKFFLSYARDEAHEVALAGWLGAELERAGHDAFLDTQIPLGTGWSSEIERQIAASDYVVVLLSAASVRSEMVLEEVRLAREHQRTSGAPAFLPLRVRYEARLPYELGAYLGGIMWKEWTSEADSPGLLQAILDVAGGRNTPPTAAISEPRALFEDFLRPAPRADLRNVVAPGGAIKPDDPFYIQRAPDLEILECARRHGETVIIKAPRQMGKSSLLKRYLRECQLVGKRTALMDLSLLSNVDLADYSRFLTCLAEDIVSQLGITPSGQVEIPNQPKMTYFLQRQVLAVVQEHIVLAFDEVDRVLGQDYQIGFFSMLRYWHERRTDTPSSAWSRVDLALIISTEPYLLIDDALQSPFNVTPPIQSHPFTLEECRVLNRHYGEPLNEAQFTMLQELLNGHPYLTRVAYYHLTRKSGLKFDALMQRAAAPDGPFGDHLRALLVKLRPKPDLSAALQQAISKGTVPNDDAFYRLKGAGLCRKEGDRIVPANQLYARFFGASK